MDGISILPSRTRCSCQAVVTSSHPDSQYHCSTCRPYAYLYDFAPLFPCALLQQEQRSSAISPLLSIDLSHRDLCIRQNEYVLLPSPFLPASPYAISYYQTQIIHILHHGDPRSEVWRSEVAWRSCAMDVVWVPLDRRIISSEKLEVQEKYKEYRLRRRIFEDPG